MDASHEPSLSLSQAQVAVAGKTLPRVTEQSIRDRIGSVAYLTHETLTIAVVVMKNGFKVIGKAAPAHPGNYDPEVGKRYAFEDAFKQLWHLEGYLLCERLSTSTARAAE